MAEGSTFLASATRLGDLTELVKSATGWSECVETLRSGKHATFDSVWGSSCALMVAAIHDSVQQPVLTILPDEKLVDGFYDDFVNFSRTRVATFPFQADLDSDDVSADPAYGARLRLLKDMRGDAPPQVIATSIQSLLQKVPGPESITSNARTVAVGQSIDLEDLKTWLATIGYQPTTSVQLPGEFSARGGILDIFSPDWEAPARIELFDTEIESIRFFDAQTQRSSTRCNQINIAGSSSIHEADEFLLRYLSKDTVILMVEPMEIDQQARKWSAVSSNVSERSGDHPFEKLRSEWSQFAIGQLGRLIPDSDLAQCRLPIELIEPFQGDVSEIRKELDRIGENREVFLLAATQSEINRVSEILKQTTVIQEKRLHFSTGILHQGFRIANGQANANGNGAAVISADQLFSRRDLRRQVRRQGSKPIDSFVDLSDGDLVVHLSHGIGRFRGLKVLTKDGHRTEHLEIEFHAGTRIFVPATKIGLVQKYVGATKTRPRLAKIGNKTWVKQKLAAEQAVNDLASDMLELQANRQTRPGIPFAADTAWQFEFEHSFPYHETSDQLSAIDAIKKDMESQRPMDRLLCGDVGFGKTEVAMRAAFKAVENGFQVAMLVPTTILAEQHHRTFRDRMAEFPLDIAKLSRFCTPAEQRDTVEGLKSGRVDIVIGTHRLTSKDISFKNLGLVIIDEEQRFGVGHKERLKTLRSEVDVLTMSATPIPRTLHMSLVGVRDISNLETPPEDRLAVQTRVGKYDESVIREAISRELSRGGQVYFVHNRVNDIQIVRQQIQHIIPEAKIVVGHGQMNEHELESAMTEFIDGRKDILLATTIIENGLDIPNANTMIINDADRYGLADLHQLRGRVGRYKNKAFCYLLVQPQRHVNPNAAKRLQAIEQYSEMGAGFAIAMRDLEIRGAGNLLGTEQSGHIATIGYELYCQLLETAVRARQKLPAIIKNDVDVDLPIEAYLPDEFVVDRKQKVDIYRRLQRVESFDEIRAIQVELRDRFGDLPPAVKRLMKLAEIRLESSLWQIASIFIEDKYLGFRFTDATRFQQLAKSSKYPIRIVDDSTAYLTLKSASLTAEQLVSLVKSILQAP